MFELFLGKLVVAASAFLCGDLVALAILPVAYDQRGYMAFGGEWIVIFACAVAGGILAEKVMHYVFD